MLSADLKLRLTQAMKEGDAVARDVLRLALGEMQTAEARENRPVNEDEAVAIVRKLVKSNRETLALSTDAAQKTALEHEIAILGALLPAMMSVEALVAALAPVLEAIKAARNDGQATGVAMKQIKSLGLEAGGPDVAVAVKQIRG